MEDSMRTKSYEEYEYPEGYDPEARVRGCTG